MAGVVWRVDLAVQGAIDAGAKPLLPIDDAFYADQLGWLVWAPGTVKEELSPEQLHERMVASHGQGVRDLPFARQTTEITT